MKISMTLIIFLMFNCIAVASASTLFAEQKAGMDPRLGSTIDASQTFTDDLGRQAPLQEFMGPGPSILVLAYFSCPNLCHILLRGMVSTLTRLRQVPGKDYGIIVVSIDPEDLTPLASSRKMKLLSAYNAAKGTSDPGSGWHFLTGDESAIRALADSIGFHFERDPNSGEYSHPSVLSFITPSGKISQYLYGLEFSSTDVDLALRQASREQTGSALQRFLMICAHYLPLERADSRNLMTYMRGLSVLFVIGGMSLIGWQIKKDRTV